MIEKLESMAGLTIPKDLASEEANQYLKNACLKFDIKCAPPQTTARLLDKVMYNLFLCWPIICFQIFVLIQKKVVTSFQILAKKFVGMVCSCSTDIKHKKKFRNWMKM
jgi:hypothetical protein